MSNLSWTEFLMSRSLLKNLPDSLVEEQVNILLETPAFRLERILSLGHITPAGEWYDQKQEEWVTVCRGPHGLLSKGGRMRF